MASLTFWTQLKVAVFLPIGVFGGLFLLYNLFLGIQGALSRVLCVISNVCELVARQQALSDDRSRYRDIINKRQKSWRMLIFSLFLVFPGVSARVFSAFLCTEVDGVTVSSQQSVFASDLHCFFLCQYLVPDFRYQCYSGEWNDNLWVAIVGLILYPIGECRRSASELRMSPRNSPLLSALSSRFDLQAFRCFPSACSTHTASSWLNRKSPTNLASCIKVSLRSCWFDSVLSPLFAAYNLNIWWFEIVE